MILLIKKPDNFDIKNIDNSRLNMGLDNENTLGPTTPIDNYYINDSGSDVKQSDSTAKLTMDNIENQIEAERVD